MTTAQIKHYESKLAFETDPSDLFEAMNMGETIIPVDVRRPAAFAKERIPGAINIPHRTINSENTKSLRKDIVYVTYCDGIGCNASTKGALKLASLGFNVKELIGGLECWKLDGYDTEGSHGMFGKKVRCVC
ncbi:MAG TPA: rhodanese-like domain-containing protein [Chryseolinea sp.]|nr:rhodanese-like domain-containing protein [Chryseolinea sp.]